MTKKELQKLLNDHYDDLMAQLNNTTNPIKYIQLDSQIMCLVDTIRLVNDLESDNKTQA